jgi:hypothetical protein
MIKWKVIWRKFYWTGQDALHYTEHKTINGYLRKVYVLRKIEDSKKMRMSVSLPHLISI